MVERKKILKEFRKSLMMIAGRPLKITTKISLSFKGKMDYRNFCVAKYMNIKVKMAKEHI